MGKPACSSPSILKTRTGFRATWLPPSIPCWLHRKGWQQWEGNRGSVSNGTSAGRVLRARHGNSTGAWRHDQLFRRTGPAAEERRDRNQGPGRLKDHERQEADKV